MFRKWVKAVTACCVTASMLCSAGVVFADDISITFDDNKDSEFDSSIFEQTEKIENIDEKDISRSNIQVYVKGYDDENGNYIDSYQRVEFPDITPMVVKERTLLPIRGVAEKLGYDVNWSNLDRRVDIIKTSKDFGDKLPAQGERVFNTLLDNSSDGGNKNEYMSTTYYYFSLKNMDRDALNKFKDRVLEHQELRYGAYLRIGDSKGVAYIANANRFGIDEARVNYQMDVPPCLYKDRTLLPLRAVGEMLGFKVIWDGDAGAVYLDGN